MDNVFLIVIISLVLAILIILLIIRNRKDERELEDQLKNDYHKSRNHDNDTGKKKRFD
jgi:Na+/H+ antiporter NhaD/arsenite permease-like protein